MASIDWNAVKLAYVTGNISMKKLAEERGISYKTLSNRAVAEGWTKERGKYRDKVGTAARARAQANELKAMENLRRAGARMCNQLERVTKEINKELHTHVVSEGFVTKTKKLDAIDSKKLANIARSMEIMSRAMDNMYNRQQENGGNKVEIIMGEEDKYTE